MNLFILQALIICTTPMINRLVPVVGIRIQQF